MEMCRACLTTGKDMIRMDEGFVFDYNLLTNLKLEQSNDNPLYSCKVCFDAVKFCIHFRQKCITSDVTLKEILLPDSKQELDCKPGEEYSMDLNLKQEVKIEYDDQSEALVYLEPLSDYDDDDTNYVIPVEGKDGERKQKKRCKSENKKIKKHDENEPVIKIKKAAKINQDHRGSGDDMKKHCGLCTKKFEDNEALGKHFEHHKFEKECGLCPERFLHFYSLLAHRIVHVPAKQMSCHICARKFMSTVYLEFHYMKKHNFAGEHDKLLCNVCAAAFPSPKHLVKHMNNMHIGGEYICEECGKVFQSKQRILSHMQRHSNKMNFECELCDYKCKFNTNMREHKLRKHNAASVNCKPCGRAFRNQEAYDKHSTTCRHSRGVLCPICGNNVKGLAQHIESHNNVHRYQCDRCPAKFKSRGCYKSHKDKHDGKPAYHCEFCPRSFYHQPVLIKHRRTHTGEKPHVCEICDKAFTAKYNLKVHMKVHGQFLVKKRDYPETDQTKKVQ